ncbi:MAG: bifunctional DedA family/phosphatase PAP2 family protein [Motiliproteus sp.]
MTEFITLLTDWLSLHTQWISITIAALALLESLVMIGLIVPGIVLLFAVAALAGSAQTPIILCLVSAMAGAITGDLISFFLGRYAHPWALSSSLFRNHPDWIKRGETFFTRYGLYSVVIGRFVGPVRPVVPFVAGMLSMSPTRFIVINLLSALAWAPVYILPGYLIGSSAQQLIETDMRQLTQYTGIMVAAIFCLGAALFMLTARMLKTPTPNNQKITDKRLLLSALSFLVLIILTVISTQTELLGDYDQTISQWFFSMRSANVDNIVIAYTLAGDSLCLLLISLPVWIWIWRNQSPSLAVSWVAGFVLLALLSQLMKVMLAVPRPELLLDPINSFAFPSSHTSNSTFFLFVLAWWISRQQSLRRKLLLNGLATAAALGMATSRLYLGAHWFSDVLAGIGLGMGFALLLPMVHPFIFKTTATERNPTTATQWRLLLLSILTIAAYVTLKLPYATAIYQPLIGTL